MEIVHSTAEEQARVWAAGTDEWGRSMGTEAYVRRETFLRTLPTATGKGMSYWVLSDKKPTTDPRPLYSTLETLNRRIWVARPGQAMFEATCHGIASVLTFPEMRGNGYATTLLTGVGELLRTHEGVDIRSYETTPSSTDDKSEAPVACSMLFSDVGKEFYAQKGWVPFQSKHLSIELDQPAPAAHIPPARPLGLDEIQALCARDQELVRARLTEPSSSGKTRIAVIPDPDLLRWHLLREDESLISMAAFRKAPTVRGAIWTGSSGARIWIIFVRSHYDDPDDQLAPDKGNKLAILRLVIDEDGAETTREELALGLEAVLRCAMEEARLWHTPHLHLWNPSDRVIQLLEIGGLNGEVVDREEEEILSVCWYGEEGVGNVEWIEADEYSWC